ncbi:MAG: hypothetical protein MMC23_008929 [Stictis urceolatum]|nr:hypothetical protein [Stictis urceolata]
MQFSAAIVAIVALGMAQAAPSPNSLAAVKVLGPDSTQQTCAPGGVFCATQADQNGNVICNSCAIAVGNSQSQCIINNDCGQSDNTCQISSDGQPHCV